MRHLTVATRSSQLALAQMRIVVSLLEKIYTDIQIRVKTVTTEGDVDRETALYKLESSGFFTNRVEQSLLSGEADFAVHSFKDLPTCERGELAIAAVCDRRYVEDCLIAGEDVSSIEQLGAKARVGTSSLRRAVQLRRLRDDIVPTSIRGNVTTRIRQLDEGKFDAIVLARAGLERLGLEERISVCFKPAMFIPASAQGALAVQVRSDDAETREMVAAIDDREGRLTALAEREVLRVLGAGCHGPAGTYAEIAGDDIKICGFLSDLEGRDFIRRDIAGPVEKAQELAGSLAVEILEAGGEKILENLKTE